MYGKELRFNPMTIQEKKCTICEAKFTCGNAKGISCWCSALPTIMEVSLEQDCLCPNCLAIEIKERIDKYLSTCSHQEALVWASQYRNNSTLVQNIDYTIEGGNYVFSRWYHLKRGACCENGCRNCPY